MNIGIIVHSLTGNTFYVANKLKDKLIEAGYSVNIEQIAAVDNADKNQVDPGKIQLISEPDVSTYDLIVLGGPVRAFSVSPVVAAFLSKTKTLQGKKVICLVTQFFPFPWMGGNRAISQMTSICKSKGGYILGTGIVNWKTTRREQRITDLVESLSKLI